MAAPKYTIKTMWGLARSAEINISEDSLYDIIARETGKDSMRALTQTEINKVCMALLQLKDSAKDNNKRLDVGGNNETVYLRRKIYKLVKELGWKDNPKRLKGLIKKMCGVETVEWLTPMQCNKVIEALKAMHQREQCLKG